MQDSNKFESKVLPILQYVGAIGATVLCIAYIVVVLVLIQGFKAEKLLETTIFAAVTAGVGFMIMQFLKVQGISLAEKIPENNELIKKYYSTKTKDKKLHSIKFFWVTTVLKDIFVRCSSLAITSVGLIYIVIEGSNDYNLLLLALVNLLTFICFGFLAMNKAYKFYNTEYINYIKEKINDMEDLECSISETKTLETQKSKY